MPITNNDVLRRLRYLFNYDDAKMAAIFAHSGTDVKPRQMANWLKPEDESGYQVCGDQQLALFLNGLIVEKRGQKEGEVPDAPMRINNNLIFRKLKIALDLQSDDILAHLKLAGLSVSKHELSAFFRRPDHKNYRPCKDQILRNFLNGLQLSASADSSPKAQHESADTGPEIKPASEATNPLYRGKKGS